LQDHRSLLDRFGSRVLFSRLAGYDRPRLNVSGPLSQRIVPGITPSTLNGSRRTARQCFHASIGSLGEGLLKRLLDGNRSFAVDHHTPGSNRYRTRCVYSLYPANSACKVWSSHRVRRISNTDARPAGINAHNDPRHKAMPPNRKKLPT
jgi:hypothetical protein